MVESSGTCLFTSLHIDVNGLGGGNGARYLEPTRKFPVIIIIVIIIIFEKYKGSGVDIIPLTHVTNDFFGRREVPSFSFTVPQSELEFTVRN